MQTLSLRSVSGLPLCRSARKPFTCARTLGLLTVRRANEETSTTATQASAEQQPQQPQQSSSTSSLEKDLTRFSRQAAGTFAPRSSTASKNPALRGTLLYNIFEVQAWVALVVGGLLSFNVIYPTDEPSIPRLMGMWAIWMFTVPSLRAKECSPTEKDALNLLFLGIPLMNVIVPFVSKSFPIIFVLNTAAIVGVYAWKGVWREIYNLPIGNYPTKPPLPPPGTSEASS